MQSDDDPTRRGAAALPDPTVPTTVGPLALPTMASIPGAEAFVPRGAGGPSALGAGFALAEFEIERVVGEGGFSVVYLALDRQLGRRVAIKEYMPGSLAVRNADLSIAPKSDRVRETFHAGLRSFVNEARLLAQFDHPSLVKVYRFWEERGTAYMVMPFYEGITLSQWRRRHGAPDEAWLRRVLGALLEAIGQLHGHNCYHRDIAPDNILLLPGDHPVLLDLGAARQIIGDMTHALTVILKPGYAPVEQYAEVDSMRQGAWTDLYALSAVLYFVVAGHAPPPAVARMVKDEMRPARDVGAGRYSDRLLAAIDAGLAVLPAGRPQDLAAFHALVGALQAPADDGSTRFLRTFTSAGGDATTMPRNAADAPASRVGTTTVQAVPAQPAPVRGTGDAPGAVAQERTALLADRGGARGAVHGDASGSARGATGADAHARSTGARRDAPPARRPLRWIAAGLGAIVVAGAIGAWMGRAQHAPQPAAVAPLAAVPLPAPHSVLAQLHAARSPSIEVRAAPSATTLRVGADKLRFAVASNISGYVYVLLAGTDANHLYLLFPNPRDGDNAITANATMLLPRPHWDVTAAGPAGVDRVLVLVSPRPRDFSAAGLREDENFGEFSLAALGAAMTRNGPAAAAGNAKCFEGAPCDTSYGAALFEISEVDGAGPK